MMKTAVVVVSVHHGNTKKLAEAIAGKYDVELIDGAQEKDFSLSDYDCIGFASGIAYGKFYPQMLELMKAKLPAGKMVFFLYTCGKRQKGYTDAAAKLAADAGCTILGEYGCLGFDTFGPFRLIGGIAKGHPDAGEIGGAVSFFEKILNS